MNRTALYNWHVKQNAKLIEFFGWSMPLHYGSQLEEHHFVRQHAGIFDISHMSITDVSGFEAKSYLRKILANDVAHLKHKNSALYSCLLDDKAGIIDDLIVYFLADNRYRIISNAGTQNEVKSWLMQTSSSYNVTIESPKNISLIALQGPKSRKILTNFYSKTLRLIDLKPFQFISDQDIFIACTGYTGEDGFEIIIPSNQVLELWNSLQEAGANPIGLGARDSLRLEAGFNLYTADMDCHTTPLETGLGWTISWEPEERKFIGRAALERQRSEGLKFYRKGLILKNKGVFRAGQVIYSGDKKVGVITSGGYSPSLNQAIALVRLKYGASRQLQVKIRGSYHPVTVVQPPFIKKRVEK